MAADIALEWIQLRFCRALTLSRRDRIRESSFEPVNEMVGRC
jgi:hypothetical protein